MTASQAVAAQVREQFHAAAQANRELPLRNGNLVELPAAVAAEVVVAGDLHGNRLNFRSLCRVADLDAHPTRHLILQEVCHGGPKYPGSVGCMSHLLLEDIACLVVKYPGRVHFLLSNHELAELTEFPILKSNRMLNLAFRTGLQEMYGVAVEEIHRAAMAFIASCCLGVRVGERILVCHSVPDQVDRQGFDASVFQRPWEAADLRYGGSVFRLVWGRDYRPENLAAFAELLQVDVVIQGHEPCPNGYLARAPGQIILDCCGETGCCLLWPLAEPASHSQLVQRIRRVRVG